MGILIICICFKGIFIESSSRYMLFGGRDTVRGALGFKIRVSRWVFG